MEAPRSFSKMPVDIMPHLVPPMSYGKYLVVRKDGKIHFETWNGTGWAYNNKVITHFYLPKIQ